MKIGFSGLTSTGKTTLATAVVEALGWRLVSEGIPQELFKTKPERAAQLLFDYASSKRKEQNAGGDCVLDRTAVDIAMLIINQFELFNFRTTHLAFAECQAMARELDVLFLLPDDGIGFDHAENEAGLKRHYNPLMRLRSSILLRGLTQRLMPKTAVVEIPSSLSTLDARLEFVLSTLQASESAVARTD